MMDYEWADEAEANDGDREAEDHGISCDCEYCNDQREFFNG